MSSEHRTAGSGWALVLLALYGIDASAAQSAATQAAATPAIRIVSLAPNLTELAFAAGAGDRIVGTPEYSDYPQAALEVARIGDAFRVDFERVLALRPDIVLAWESGTPEAVIGRLQALQLNVKTIATHRLAAVAQAVREIGSIAGTSATADAVAARFENDIAALRKEYSERAVVSVFLQINDRPLYTVNGKQIMSEIVELCGGRNVFAGLSDLAPQIGIEAVIAANPQVIISTDDSGAEALARWQRWTHVTAVKTGNVYAVPPEHIARATTRLAGGAKAICRTLETARQRGGQLADW